MCKVGNCKQNHQKHYCRVCKNSNSTHLSGQCPEGTILYHGTKKEYADSIVKTGFKASQSGRIGPGVYFTGTSSQAKKIAYHRFKDHNPVVIQCIAKADFGHNLSKTDSQAQILKKLDEWYKFCQESAKKGFHPPWAGNGEFKQYCVKDPKRIKVIKVHNV